MLTVFSLFYACNKVEENLLSESTKVDKTNSASAARKGAPTDSLEYYANLISPTGAITEYIKNGGRLPETKFFKDFRGLMNTSNIGNGYFPYSCANNLLVLGYPGAVCPGGGSGSRISNNNLTGLDCPTYINDAWNNKIYALGVYGPDDRNGYYVYLPNNFNATSPIVVLVHGGGWSIGPNPENTNGWAAPFSSTPTQTNFVKDLLNNDFVVVVPLYRLSRYGNTDAEINGNTTGWETEIDDIDAAIVHVRTNFPSCLGINANSIQILGESAGGHLALQWAYTKTTIPSTFIKSVVDMYAPTNLQQYGNYLKNIPVSANFICGGLFFGLPWWFPIADLTNPLEIYNTTVFDCKAQGYPNSRVLQSYKMIQSLVATAPIATPLTSLDLLDASPFNTLLVSTREIPTFVMHGKNDGLVPYNQATSMMNTNLSTRGGLLFNFTSSSGVVPTTYTSSLKHGIKQYDNANHAWGTTNVILTPQATLYNLVRSDAIKWLNGHK